MRKWIEQYIRVLKRDYPLKGSNIPLLRRRFSSETIRGKAKRLKIKVNKTFKRRHFKNTLGKYLLGIEIIATERDENPSFKSYFKRSILKVIFPIEGLVLLLSKNNKRLGDLWAKTIVINKGTNYFRPSARALIGIIALLVLVFSFRISMGLAVKNADFYNIGINGIKSNTAIKIIGLPKFVNQTRHTVNFFVPISNENQDKYAIIYLEKNGTDWSVNHTDFTKEHIIGFSYSFSDTSSKR